MSELLPMLKFDLRAILGAQGGMAGLLVLLVGGLVALSGNASVAFPMIFVVSMMLGLSLFTADDTYRLRQLHGTLPVTRRTVLTSHYLVGVGTMAVLGAVGLGATLLGTRLRGESVQAAAAGGLLVFGMLLLVYALQIPLILRFGAARAGMAFMATITGMTVLFGVFLLVSETASGGGVRVPSVVSATVLPWVAALADLPGVGVGVGLLALVPSWLVALRIYTRQDH